MSSSGLIRFGALAAMAGGAAWISLWYPLYLLMKLPGSAGLSPDKASIDNIVYVALLLGAAAAVAALHTLQRRCYGRTGTLASLAALSGLALAAAEMVVGYGATGPATDPFLAIMPFLLGAGILLTTGGLVVLGIATITAGVLPWWCGVALVAGSPPVVLAGLVFLGVAGELAMMPVGVAWMLVGYAIFRTRRRDKG